MTEERWFISYRKIIREFLAQQQRVVTYHTTVTNVTPAHWVREHGADYHIQYAEKITLALASELAHGGAGIPTEYYDLDY